MNTLIEIINTPRWLRDGKDTGAMATNGPAPATPTAPAVRILLVEDNAINRRVAIGILTKLGCEVKEAENGQVAMDLLRTQSFDLVFMDVQMPVMDGFEATQRIRADSRWADLPIVAMTAHAMKGDRERCLQAGMSDYVAKPIRLEVIRNMIGKWGRPSVASPPPSDTAPIDAGTTACPSPQGAVPVLEVESAVANLGGDRALYLEVLQAFLETLPAQVDQLRQAVSQGEVEQVQLIAHSLKGSASNIGAESTRRLAAELDEVARAGNTRPFVELLAGLESTLEPLRAAIEDALTGVTPAHE